MTQVPYCSHCTDGETEALSRLVTFPGPHAVNVEESQDVNTSSLAPEHPIQPSRHGQTLSTEEEAGSLPLPFF